MSNAKLYGYKWQQARLKFLQENPLCAFHLRRGETVAASVVDHIVPHKNDLKLFWRRSNWQALCKHCHDSHKQRSERSGTVVGCNVSGIPIDVNHHWNRGGGG